MKIKSFEDIVKSGLTYIRDNSDITNFNKGGVARTLVGVLALVVSELYNMLAYILKQAFVETATGYWLERHARQVGLERKKARVTKGVFRFSREVAKTNNITIPKNTPVATEIDAGGNVYRFFTTKEAILLANTTYIDVDVIAEYAGSVYNIEAQTRLQITVHIAGVDGVSVLESWITSEGADEESDTSLRNRIRLKWSELSGCTASAYLSWVLSHASVVSAWVDHSQPRGDGTLDIYILGPNGIPSASLILEIQKLVDLLKAYGVHVLIKAPDPLTIDWDMAITPKAGFDIDAILTEAQYRIDILFNLKQDETREIVPLGVGVDLVVSRLTSMIQTIEGVYSVDVERFVLHTAGSFNQLIEPARNIVVDPDQYPAKGDISISFNSATTEI